MVNKEFISMEILLFSMSLRLVRNPSELFGIGKERFPTCLLPHRQASRNDSL